MKNYRLFGIVYLLLLKRQMTAKELANYFEVSERTIHRDIDVLTSLDIPIYANKGKNGGFCLLEHYQLNNMLLSEDEQNQILFAIESLNQLSIHNQEILDKMQALFQKQHKDWIQVDLSIWKEKVIDQQVFESIKEAIFKEKKIEFIYYNAKQERKLRKVEPLQIQFQYNAWYVFAYEQQIKDYRLFKLNRIKDLKILDETIIKPLPKETLYSFSDVEYISLELQISKEMAYRVYDEFSAQAISILDNGDFYIKVNYPQTDWIYSYILSFGEYIKVISPIYIKTTIQHKLEKMITHY